MTKHVRTWQDQVLTVYRKFTSTSAHPSMGITAGVRDWLLQEGDQGLKGVEDFHWSALRGPLPVRHSSPNFGSAELPDWSCTMRYATGNAAFGF